ncbi:MAG: four helix bundle protein [Calditrichaeota bacterium]|nr:four helix bundle protein [Calditrichota bacterium]
MKPAKSFTDLIVWQKAHQFVLRVYEETTKFPNHETYGLRLQFRRAAISIAANIAEGFRKHSLPDKARFLNIAEGSLEECRYFLILSKDLKYIEIDYTWNLSTEVGKLLSAYKKKIQDSKN